MLSDERCKELLHAVDTAPAIKLRNALRFLVMSMACEKAGLLENPFAYLPQSDWDDFCEKLGATRSMKPR
jgi:hypothetical protein